MKRRGSGGLEEQVSGLAGSGGSGFEGAPLVAASTGLALVLHWPCRAQLWRSGLPAQVATAEASAGHRPTAGALPFGRRAAPVGIPLSIGYPL
jgi:hypothetical protein